MLKDRSGWMERMKTKEAGNNEGRTQPCAYPR